MVEPPVFVLLGLTLHADVIAPISEQFLDLKSRYFPGLMKSVCHHLDSVLVEVKASDLRQSVRAGTARARRTAIGFLDRVFDLLDSHSVRLLARVYVKPPGGHFSGRSVYAYSMQALCRGFQNYLVAEEAQGVVIADSRTHQLDQGVAHSLYTMKHRMSGDELDRVLEVPTFGRSGNHVGLQLADLIGGVLFPIATRTYCQGTITGAHVAPEYDHLRTRYSARLRGLQHRYQEDGRWRGGITVSDRIGMRSGSELFARP